MFWDLICALRTDEVRSVGVRDFLEGEGGGIVRSSGVDLPEIDTEGFATNTKWLYIRHLYLRGTVDDVLPKRSQVPGPIKTSERRHWLTYYQTGDYLQDADFRGAIFDAVVQLYNRSIAKKKNNLSLFFVGVYEWTTIANLHRSFVVDTCVA